jgi:hypothetical protein
VYSIPLAGGASAASTAAALTLPNSSEPVVNGAHQVLAFTGFAFGAYVVVALALIMAGFVLRRLSATPRRAR